MAAEVPVSVAIPTIGRTDPLRRCLESLAACAPRAAEILVVDQSQDPAVAQLVMEFAPAHARLVPCDGVGPSKARNVGLHAAQNAIVALTDDDCIVSTDWVGTAWQLMERDSERIVTGRVLPAGDPRAVPSTREDTTPRDFTGTLEMGVLFSNNMVVDRSLTLAAGGFDERFQTAEDNDLCYRWLKAGRRLQFEPSLVVWHLDWRTHDELVRLYVRYMEGEGLLYAKHLLHGDLRMLRLIGRDVGWWLRAVAAAVVKGTPRWADPRRAILRGLPVGLWRGWREFRREDGRGVDV
jgi:GT2 family glycosyltransferase